MAEQMTWTLAWIDEGGQMEAVRKPTYDAAYRSAGSLLDQGAKRAWVRDGSGRIVWDSDDEKGWD